MLYWQKGNEADPGKEEVGQLQRSKPVTVPLGTQTMTAPSDSTALTEDAVDKRVQRRSAWKFRL